ncbi:PAS domain-containing sensor histidine kinase [Ferruginivarius sediminum]|uniref:histidine kinase n=1 Tax=Ferruginivarius sediminum TaxID=2661937 RepID=A0A369TGC1_9PROT|nr:PAS domain S-box protein [Ferruginivarius sediminum]RDD61956.1 PAS domain S-box protein [Ferruginivarius sediminum]
MAGVDTELAEKLAAQDAALTASGVLMALVVAGAIFVVILILRVLRQREIQASQATQRFDDITDVSAEWIWETDSQHCFTYFSQRLREVTGLDLQTLYGRSRWDIAQSRMADPLWREHLNDLAARRPFSNFVYELTDGHGCKRSIMVSGKPVFDHGGTFLGYRGTGIDVTASMQAHEAARAAERRASAVIAATLDAFLATDGEGRVVDWNERAEALLGWSRAEAVGQPIDTLFTPDESEAPEGFCFRRYITEACYGPGQTKRVETALRNRQGRTFPVELTVTSIAASGGWQYAAFIRDISKERESAQALREAKESAEIANRTKSQFLAAMSHELRTPLNAVIGFSEIMERGLLGPLPVAYQSYSKDIRDSGRHLLNVINDILDISKVEAGRIELNEGAVDVFDMAESSIRLVEERAQRSGVSVVNEVPADLPAIWVDEQRLKQILLNLLTNAVKFTPGGTVRVGAEVDGDMLVRVCDDGVGMDVADVPDAMTAFVQLDSGLDRKHEGTGLGLPLCERLAKLHGGTLHIDSAPGEGTTVTLRFPAERIMRDSAARAEAGK